MTRRTLSNEELATILQAIGEMLDLQGANPFRVRAYERAADVVRYHGSALSDLYAEGGIKVLDAIEGIGKGISAKLETLLTKGMLPYYERLRKKIPAVELELMTIPGVGPKTARKLYQKLKPKSIPDLSTKLQRNGEKHFGEKTVANILASIEMRKRVSGRYLLSFAEPIGREVAEFLRSQSGVSAADSAGSLRRMRETVGDIDLVAAAKDSKAVIDALLAAPFVSRVMAAGETKATVLHRAGIQVDVELVAPTEYGSLLQHFTGSKAHNVALRTWAESKGWSLSEHGLARTNSGRVTTTRTEAQFYQTLGMDWIPPELREDRGEIEAALHHELPQLIELKDIRGNLHVHTTTSDGQESLETMVKAAHAYGYDYVAITDHSKSLGVAQGLDDRKLLRHAAAIRTLDARYRKKGMRILAGVELNILADGSLDLRDETLAKLDFVIASVHSSFAQSKETVTKRVLAAIENPYVDCIGHPTGRLLDEREGIDLDWELIYQAAAKTKTLLEINAFPDRLDLPDSNVKAAAERGVHFVINTDAHHPRHFEHMRYGVAVARRGWLEPKSVANTWTFSKLESWLKAKQS